MCILMWNCSKTTLKFTTCLRTVFTVLVPFQVQYATHNVSFVCGLSIILICIINDSDPELVSMGPQVICIYSLLRNVNLSLSYIQVKLFCCCSCVGVLHMV